MSSSRLVYVALTSLGLVVAACNNADVDSAASPPATQESESPAPAPDYLFVLSGHSGSFDGTKLTLNDVPNVIEFTDRPLRSSDHMSVERFVARWSEGGAESFATEPPNADLSVLDEGVARNSVIRIDGVSLENGSLVFEIQPLGESAVESEFGAASLFIDPDPCACGQPCPSCFSSQTCKDYTQYECGACIQTPVCGELSP